MHTAQIQSVLDGDLDLFIEAFLRQKTLKDHQKPPPAAGKDGDK